MIWSIHRCRQKAGLCQDYFPSALLFWWSSAIQISRRASVLRIEGVTSYRQVLKFSCIIVREFYSTRGCNKTERGSGDSPRICNSSSLLRPASRHPSRASLELSENRSGNLTALAYMTKACVSSKNFEPRALAARSRSIPKFTYHGWKLYCSTTTKCLLEDFQLCWQWPSLLNPFTLVAVPHSRVPFVYAFSLPGLCRRPLSCGNHLSVPRWSRQDPR